MKYLIVGCGRLGTILATTLAEEQHQVTVIDRDQTAFARLGPTSDVQQVVGVAFDRTVLESAGITSADGFATMTNADNTNFVLAAVARRRYRVPRVVARIYDPVRAEIYTRLGIPTVSPTTWGAARVKELLTYGHISPLLDLGNGEVEVVEVEAGTLLDGHPAADLCVPETIQLISIVRGGHALIPHPTSLIRARDLLQIALRTSARGQLASMVGN
jgi:trk system potassium uptake protein TrkA